MSSRSEVKRVEYRKLIADKIEFVMAGVRFHCMPCYYCGMPQSCFDHCPPLCMVETLLDHDLVHRNQCVLVPSCSDCNSRLNGCAAYTPVERRGVIKGKLADKLNRSVRAVWEEDEIEELGPNLQREVRVGQRKEEVLEYRLRFSCKLKRDVQKSMRAVDVE